MEFPDRPHFLKATGWRWKMAEAGHQPLSLVLVSIDHYRECGGLAADVCLRGVVDAIHANTDATDCLVGRVRDHEFAIVCGEQDAETLAERIRKDVESQQLQPTADGGPLTVSCSVVSDPPQRRRGIEALLIVADRALREATRRGGNLVIGH